MRTMIRIAVQIVLPLALLATGCARDVESRKRAFFESANRYVDQGKYREAIVEYRNAVQLDEHFGEARARLALAYERIGDGAHAGSEYVRAADLLRDNLDLQVAAGNYLLAARRFEEAQSRATYVLERDSSNVRAQVLLGNALGGLRQFDEAIAEMEQAIKLDPGRAASYAQLGVLEAGRGQQQAAEQAFKKAVTLAPNWMPGHLALAYHYWASRRTVEAEDSLRRALELEPQNSLANRAMALFLVGSQRVSEAEPFVKTLASGGAAPFALADYYMVTGRAAAAVPELERLQSDARTRDAAVHRLARAHALLGDWRNVNRLVDETLARTPGDAEMLLIKGTALMRQDRRTDAVETLKLAAQANDSSASIQFALGGAFARTGDLEGARNAYAEAVKIDPAMARAQVELARLDLYVGQPDLAVRRSRDAVRSDPSNVDAQLTLVRALLARKDLAAADGVLAELVRTHPNLPMVHVQRGIAFAAREDAADARAAFERAAQLDPKLADAIAGLVALDMHLGNVAAAKARIDAQLRAAPDRLDLLLIAARTYAGAREPSIAEELLRRAIKLDAAFLPAYNMLGQLYVAQGKLEDAKREFQLLAERQSRPVAPLTVLGMIAQLQGDDALARKHFERVLLMEPRAPIAENNLAWMYAEQGENLDTALQYAQNAATALPNVAAVHDTLGWVYYKKEIPDRAVAAFTESVKKEPNNPLFHYHLGLALRQGGDPVRARRSLERALELSATFDGSGDARRVLAEIAAGTKAAGV